jgi:hypothetical protein
MNGRDHIDRMKLSRIAMIVILVAMGLIVSLVLVFFRVPSPIASVIGSLIVLLGVDIAKRRNVGASKK